MKKRTALDLTEGPVLRKLLLFAVPLMINSAVQSLYSTADSIMVGQFVGSNAMAAVGASAAPINLLINLFLGLALGVNVVCANLKGAQKTEELRRCMQTTVLLSLLVGFAVALLGIPLTRPLLDSMDTPAEILDDAVLYMFIRLAAGPVWMMSSFLANIFYAYGETRMPMVLNLCSGLVNVALNALFLMGFGMGVEGVAIATAVSQAINAAVYVIVLYDPKGEYRLRGLSLDGQHVRSILTVGIPTGMNSIVFSASNALLQSSVNSFGATVVAGNSATDSLSAYVYLIVSSLCSASLSATSQCYGAKKYKRIDAIIKKSVLGTMGMVAVAAVLMTVFAHPLLELFVKKSEPGWQDVVKMGIPKLMFTCWGYLIFVFSEVYSACLKGIREATAALFCNLFGVIVPRLLWVWLVIPQMHTPNIIYAIYPISWGLSGVVTAAAFLHHRKRKLLHTEPV